MLQQVQTHPQHQLLTLLRHSILIERLWLELRTHHYQNYIMSDEEIAFDDWEKEAELIISNNKEKDIKQEEAQVGNVKDNPEQICDPYQQHLMQIERIKNMTADEFTVQFMQKDERAQNIEPFSALLKAEKEFIDLASNISEHFRAQAKRCPQKVLPESETVAFFEQFLLYLYPDLQWESIEAVKEKTKIVKKQKKEEEAKVKKMREKELRLKRGFNKQENNEKEIEVAKAQQNQAQVDESM